MQSEQVRAELFEPIETEKSTPNFEVDSSVSC